MGNIQTGDKHSKTGKSPARSKNFIKNLNRKSPGRESKKHERKKSDCKRDAIDRECDKVESDNITNEVDEPSAGERLTVNSCVSAPAPAPAPAPPRSTTHEPGYTPTSVTSEISDSLFTPLTPLACSTELNQCYYSAESDSPPDMPQQLDDVTLSDIDRGENENVMGALLSTSRGEHLERITHECNHDFKENRLKASPGQTSFTLSRHKKVELSPAVLEPTLLEQGTKPTLSLHKINKLFPPLFLYVSTINKSDSQCLFTKLLSLIFT